MKIFSRYKEQQNVNNDEHESRRPITTTAVRQLTATPQKPASAAELVSTPINPAACLRRGKNWGNKCGARASKEQQLNITAARRPSIRQDKNQGSDLPLTPG